MKAVKGGRVVQDIQCAQMRLQEAAPGLVCAVAHPSDLSGLGCLLDEAVKITGCQSPVGTVSRMMWRTLLCDLQWHGPYCAHVRWCSVSWLCIHSMHRQGAFISLLMTQICVCFQLTSRAGQALELVLLQEDPRLPLKCLVEVRSCPHPVPRA